VTILLANYNHAQYLPTSLSGICGQSHPADEIIVVDDGSTDSSVEVIAEFAGRYPNIRLLTNGHNRGQHYSIQRALAAARTEYVVWASSDDLLLPCFLGNSLDILRRHPQAGLCFSRLAVFVDGTSETREYTGETQGVAFDYGPSARFLSPADLLAILRKHYLWMSGNTVVARRTALLEIGGFEQNLKWHADWFAFYAIALRYGACVIPETLALMRERPDTYSAGGTSDARQQNKVLQAIFDTMKSHRHLDIGHVFRRCPSILSLFGKKALFAALRAPRHWDFALSIARLLGPRYLYAKYGRLRAWLSARLHG
jgi:glycosyltransferase involved in cell wall biosynthesis